MGTVSLPVRCGSTCDGPVKKLLAVSTETLLRVGSIVYVTMASSRRDSSGSQEYRPNLFNRKLRMVAVAGVRLMGTRSAADCSYDQRGLQPAPQVAAKASSRETARETITLARIGSLPSRPI